MDAVRTLLEFGVGLFHAERNFFKPETERFPVDEKNDLQRDERIAEREAGEVGGGEFLARARDRAD